MITTSQIIGNNVKFFGQHIEVGCLTVLYDLNNSKELYRTTTNKRGYFEFILSLGLVPSGKYQIQFYGSGYKVLDNLPLGDWETFDFINPFDSLPPIIYSGLSLDIYERCYPKENKGSITSTVEAHVIISGVELYQSKVTKVGIERRFSDKLSSCVLYFSENPEPNSSIEIYNSGITSIYFVPQLISGNQILIGETKEDTLFGMVSAFQNNSNLEGILYSGIQNLENLFMYQLNASTIEIFESTLSSFISGYISSTVNGIYYNSINNLSTSGYFQNGCIASGINDNDWKSIGTYNVDWSTTSKNNNLIAVIKDVPHAGKGISSDFRISFYNDKFLGSWYEDKKPSQITQSHIFDGRDDLELQYLSYFSAVHNLIAKNATLPMGSSDPDNPAEIANTQIELRWDDMTQFYNGIELNPIALISGHEQVYNNINSSQIRNIDGYGIFEYIITNNNLNYDALCPISTVTLSGATGYWCFVDKVKTNYYTIDLPENKLINLWVGFGTKETFYLQPNINEFKLNYISYNPAIPPSTISGIYNISGDVYLTTTNAPPDTFNLKLTVVGTSKSYNFDTNTKEIFGENYYKYRYSYDISANKNSSFILTLNTTEYISTPDRINIQYLSNDVILHDLDIIPIQVGIGGPAE